MSAAPQLVSALNPQLSAPPNGNGDSWSPIITPDGRYVLFASTANNLVETADGNGVAPLNPPSVNVYLRDRHNQTTVLVSVNLAGTGGNGNSFPTALSTNGQFALFESAASDLAANDTNNANDVFLRDTVNGWTSLVSVSTNGTCANGTSRGSTMSPDGRYVAFVSTAANLASNHTNGLADVFVRDMQEGTTVLASVGAISNGITSSSESPEITPDGRYVAFSSTATNLVRGVTTAYEIYVRDLQAGVTTWASTNARVISGFGSTGFCYNQAVSDNGQFVAFEIGSNAVAYSTSTAGVIFYYNLQTGVTTTVFTNAVSPVAATLAVPSLNMTPDGQSIVYTANSGTSTCVYLWNAQAGTNLLVSGNLTNGITAGATVYSPDIDRTGRYVIFVSTDKSYLANTNAAAAVLVRDTQAGTTMVASVDTNGLGLPVNVIAVPAVSAGGSVAFESPWANLDGRNYQSDVFAFDLTNPASELISVHDPNLPSFAPNGPNTLWAGSMSTNGRYAAFSSWANNLAAGDTNGYLNVFVHDLITGTNILVSASNGIPGNDLSTEPAISGNGRYVVFTSAATNLVSVDTNQASDVFLHDLQTGSTTLISISTNGGVGNGNSFLPQISQDGNSVLFCSSAQNLAPGAYGSYNLYLRDVQTSKTYALTTNGFSQGGFQSYSMTPNGQFVAFVGTNSAGHGLFVWNFANGFIYTNSISTITNVSLSPDGGWLAFVEGGTLFARDLVAGTNCEIATGIFGPRAGLKFSSDDRFLTYQANTNIYLYDFEMGMDLLVSTAFDSTNAANGSADSPVISADGSLVAYRSFSSNAIPQNPSGVPAILLFNRLTNSTVLASANLGGISPVKPSSVPLFTADGQMLVFQSWARDLVPGDFNPGSDLFALDLLDLQQTNVVESPTAFNAGVFFTGSYSAALIPVVTWPLTPGETYSVQYKDDLNDPVWHNLEGSLTFIGAQAYQNDPSSAVNQRFYRVVLGPLP